MVDSPVEIRPWLFVGSRNVCDTWTLGRVIHIWRHDLPGGKCDAAGESSGEITFDYVDANPLAPQWIEATIARVREWRDAGDKVLVHCSAGRARSPTVTVAIVSGIEQRHPLDVAVDVTKRFLAAGRQHPVLYQRAMASIVRWFESKYPERRLESSMHDLNAIGDQTSGQPEGYNAAADRIELEIGKPTGLCIDIGCNTGAGMQVLSQRWRDTIWHGIEPAGTYAAMARARGFPIVHGSAEKMPWADGMVDFVFSRHSLEHIPNRERVIAEIRRVLRVGGHVYAQIPIEPAGSKNELHVSAFRSGAEIQEAFDGFERVYWGPQETVAEIIGRKV